MTAAPRFLLRYQNPSGGFHEARYLSVLGEMHGSQRLVAHTTTHQNKALRFNSAPEAAQTLLDIRSPAGWDIVESAETI